jgi:hypothetical protein
MNTLVCHTVDCINEDLPVEFDLAVVDPNDGTVSYVDSVICGPCRQPITDIDPPIQQGKPL